METIQILLIIFAIFAWTRVILRLKDKHIRLSEFIFWSLVWLIMLIVAFIPSITSSMAEFLGIASGISLLVYVSVIILFYLVFRLYVKIEHQEQEITQLTRALAIKNSEKKKKNRGL
ncbi:MAG: DUF2304 family protein [Candidatus Woesearchaeota archaeon]